MQDHRPRNEEDTPDFLQGLKEENPFVVPHNYFKTLPDQVLDRLREGEESQVQQRVWPVLERWLIALWSPRPALALATVLLAIGAFVFWPSGTEDAWMAADFSSDEILQYVSQNLDDFEAIDLYDGGELDLLGEIISADDVDPYLEDLLEDVDIETLQDIL